MAADATVNAINIAVNKGKAFLAATTGTKAALTASDRSVNIKTYDSLSKGGRKMLSHASGNNNNNNNNKVGGATQHVPPSAGLHRFSCSAARTAGSLY